MTTTVIVRVKSLFIQCNIQQRLRFLTFVLYFSPC
ncbi:hypothetical protein VCHENC02_0392A, partial [Vibrio harveyi]